MKNGKRAVSFILAVALLCTSFAGCGMVQQDKAYLEQVAAAVTETQSILKDVEAAADELSGQSSIVYENSVNAEGFDVLDEYYTLCTEKLNALNDAVGAVAAADAEPRPLRRAEDRKRQGCGSGAEGLL